METKQCRLCGTAKPLTDFHRRAAAKDGHHSACKPCAIAEQNRSKMKPPKWHAQLHDQSALGLKQCAHCRALKPFAEFVRNKNFFDGHNHICKACLYPQRVAYEKRPEGKAIIAAGMKRRYWKDPEAKRADKVERAHRVPKGTREALFKLQGGVCAICGENRRVGGRHLAIDHDHTTKEIRGLLCIWCNQAIGQLQENPELLRKAAAYLENPPAAHLYLTSVFVRKSGQ